jgi:hypothetical protein
MNGSTAYGLVLTNNGSNSIRFEVVPDIAYAHLACTYNTIVATTASRWDQKSQQWEAHDTFISGVETSGKRDYKTTPYDLKPGRSLCAGWWLPDDAILSLHSQIKLTACTTFRDTSRCFDSPPFRVDSSPSRSHLDATRKQSRMWESGPVSKLLPHINNGKREGNG